MDKDGVDVSVVLNYGWSTQSLCAEVNDYILESVRVIPNVWSAFAASFRLKMTRRFVKSNAVLKTGQRDRELRLDII